MTDPDPLDAVQLETLTETTHHAMHGRSQAEQHKLLTEGMRKAYALGRDGREEAAVSQRTG